MKDQVFTARGILVLGVILALILLAPLTLARQQQSLSSTAFTYQGQLQEEGAPASGSYDFRFQLWDAASGGNVVGGPISLDSVSVDAGHFTVSLNFGDVFDGQDRYLEIGVRPAGAGGDYTVLDPRQRLSATPYAIYADSANTAPWSGLTGVPAGFADGTDNDTTYTAGDGLALQGNQFNVSTLPMPGWSDTVVDSGNVGNYSSVIVGLDGLPVISYYDDNSGDLKVAHCHDLACSDATISTVDSAGVVGKYTSITIGRSGHPLISYYDDSNGDLKLASCNDVACTTADLQTVDSAGDVGQYSSITANEHGYAFISYYDAGNQDLKAINCSNLTCSSNFVWTVDSAGAVGQYTSVTRNSNDYGYISYYDASNGNLKVARCVGMSCNTTVINTVDGAGTTGSEEDDVGLYSSITTGSDGFPLIAYAKAYQEGSPGSASQMRVAHCTNTQCSTADVDVMISASTINWQAISITLGRDGLGLISAGFDTTSRIYVFHCNDVACSGQTISDGVVISGAVDSALTVGADGLPILSYSTDTDNALRLVHCSDWSCQPYLRRR